MNKYHFKMIIGVTVGIALSACTKKETKEETSIAEGPTCTVADCTDPADLTLSTLDLPTFTFGAMATDGNFIYSGYSTLTKIDPTTLESTVIAGTGSSGYGEGTGTNAILSSTSAAEVSGNNLFFTDYDFHVLRKIDLTTFVTSLVAGVPGTRGNNDYDGSPAMMDGPSGIALHGDIRFVVDRANLAIRYMFTGGTAMYTFAGTKGVSGTADGIGTSARFGLPEDIVRIGPDLYVTDSENHNIRKIRIATKRVTTFAGTTGVSGFTDGIGLNATFNRPSRIATDGSNLYVIDLGNYAIRRVNIESGQVTTLIGGEQNYVDGPGDQARIGFPSEILYLNNALYLTDETVVDGSNRYQLRILK